MTEHLYNQNNAPRKHSIPSPIMPGVIDPSLVVSTFDPDLPVYPELVDDEDGFWRVSQIQISGFAGLQVPSDFRGALSGSKYSDGYVKLSVTIDDDYHIDDATIKETVNFIINNAEEIMEIYLKSTMEVYKDARPNMVEAFVDANADNYVPEIHHHNDLKRLCRINSVYVNERTSGGELSFSLALDCNWEDHGSGVVFEGLKIVDGGYADVCY